MCNGNQETICIFIPRQFDNKPYDMAHPIYGLYTVANNHCNHTQWFMVSQSIKKNHSYIVSCTNATTWPNIQYWIPIVMFERKFWGKSWAGRINVGGSGAYSRHRH